MRRVPTYTDCSFDRSHLEGSVLGNARFVRCFFRELSNGQDVQVHFYQNKVTGEVNYNIDFKVKGAISPIPINSQIEPTASVYVP